MTLEEAIGKLEDLAQSIWPTPGTDRHDALKLGIEALKRVKNARDIGYPVPADSL